MIPDKLLINLKIISKIQKNGRITRSYDGIISLENEIFYQSIKRFFSNDSRRQATFEINSVINEAVDMLRHILNSKYMHKNFYHTDEYIKNCENISLLLTELEAAKTGIENLKFTYQNDQNTSSQIDIIILKINTNIRDFSQKLQYFQSKCKYNYTTSLPQNYDLHSIKIDNGQNEYTDQNDYADRSNYEGQNNYDEENIQEQDD
jgi:phosphoglycerate-specific signal transduction histidine kinase